MDKDLHSKCPFFLSQDQINDDDYIKCPDSYREKYQCSFCKDEHRVKEKFEGHGLNIQGWGWGLNKFKGCHIEAFARHSNVLTWYSLISNKKQKNIDLFEISFIQAYALEVIEDDISVYTEQRRKNGSKR